MIYLRCEDCGRAGHYKSQSHATAVGWQPGWWVAKTDTHISFGQLVAHICPECHGQRVAAQREAREKAG